MWYGFLAVVVLGVVESGPVEAGIVLTANVAGSQSSLVAKVTTENFDSFKTGIKTSLTTAVGSISSPGLAIDAADQYGGAGGTGNFIVVGAQSGQTSMTLTLNGAQAYFGFWWSAADSLNKIQFYSSDQLIGTFDSAMASGALGSGYLGNPNNGQDSSEKFAYLNFFGSNGTTFDKIVFSNASTGTGFESDNWSVLATAVTPQYPGNPISGFTAVPEPSSMILCLSGLVAIVGVRRRLTSPSSPGLP